MIHFNFAYEFVQRNCLSSHSVNEFYCALSFIATVCLDFSVLDFFFSSNISFFFCRYCWWSLMGTEHFFKLHYDVLRNCRHIFMAMLQINYRTEMRKIFTRSSRTPWNWFCNAVWIMVIFRSIRETMYKEPNERKKEEMKCQQIEIEQNWSHTVWFVHVATFQDATIISKIAKRKVREALFRKSVQLLLREEKQNQVWFNRKKAYIAHTQTGTRQIIEMMVPVQWYGLQHIRRK